MYVCVCVRSKVIYIIKWNIQNFQDTYRLFFKRSAPTKKYTRNVEEIKMKTRRRRSSRKKFTQRQWSWKWNEMGKKTRSDRMPSKITLITTEWLCVTTNRVAAQARLEQEKELVYWIEAKQRTTRKRRRHERSKKKKTNKTATRDEHHVKWTTTTHKNYEWHTLFLSLAQSLPCSTLLRIGDNKKKETRTLCVHYHSCFHNSHSNKRM